MDNNIFDFGKSELTHDAIISWIINGFNFPDSAKEFYIFSRNFINLLDKNLNLDLYNKVEIKNQFNIKIEFDSDSKDESAKNKKGKIDILATFSNDNSSKYYLVIEDKVFSGENGNQFEEYVKAVNSNETLKDESKKFVNIILSNFSKYYIEKVNNNEWQVVTRKDISKIIPEDFSYETPEFVLLKYYRNYLFKLDKDYSSFKINDNLNDWSRFAILGFFSELVSEMVNTDFGYVNNVRGGFCVLWLEKRKFVSKDGFEFNVYIQLEFKPKDEIKDNHNRKSDEKLEWFIRIKLEDINYNDKSKVFAKNIKTEKLKKIDCRYCEVKYHRGKHLTICSKQIVSNNLNSLKDEIRENVEIFNDYIEEIGEIIKS